MGTAEPRLKIRLLPDWEDVSAQNPDGPPTYIRKGAFYLAFIGKTIGADPATMLAGYYAGPGNAQAWQALSGGDPDLFVEVIRLPDAKNYAQTAYEYFMEYAELYEEK